MINSFILIIVFTSIVEVLVDLILSNGKMRQLAKTVVSMISFFLILIELVQVIKLLI